MPIDTLRLGVIDISGGYVSTILIRYILKQMCRLQGFSQREDICRKRHNRHCWFSRLATDGSVQGHALEFSVKSGLPGGRGNVAVQMR
jgi:hypothetical protein